MSPDDDKSPIPLSRIRAKLARPRGYRRVEALLSTPDPAAAVAALSVPDLYQLIKGVGFADTIELVALATPEQIRGCLDMDLWDRDQLQTPAVAPWLTSLIEVGYEKLGQVWEGLDSELTALVLQRHTHIYDLSLEEEPPENTDNPMFTTPDTFFAIELISDDGELNKLIHRLVEDLYRADMVLARHTLMAARTEPPAELEEMSYRWRSGRMADLGYVDFYEALAVFRPIDPASVSEAENTADQFGAVDGDGALDPGDLPAEWAEQVVGRSFLARALGQLGDEAEAKRAETALVVLVNKVLSALRVSPGDEDQVAEGTAYATATLALGLETLSRGDVDHAGRLLRNVSFTRLHRVGFTTTLRLARFARAIAPRALTAGPVDAAVLEALLAPQPLLAGELDEPPVATPRPFESVRDVRAAAEHMTRLALRVAIADSLQVDLIAVAEMPEPRPALDDHIRTALVRVMAGGEFSPARLASAEVAAFLAGAFADGVLTDAARETAWQAMQSWAEASGLREGGEYLPELIKGWLGDVEATFGSVDAADVDARFVDMVLLAGEGES